MSVIKSYTDYVNEQQLTDLIVKLEDVCICQLKSY